MEKQEMESLRCPNCFGPADIQDFTDLNRPITCKFCGTVYTLRKSQDDFEQFKKDILAQITAAMNNASSISIDPAARHFFFEKDLYSTLKREFDQHLAALEIVSEAPLISLKPLMRFQDYQAHPRLLAIAAGNNQWLKKLSFQVSSQELRNFAITPQDQQKLRELQFQLSILGYQVTIARHLATLTTGSYQPLYQNLLALKKEYQEYAQALTDPTHRSYIMALAARTHADILLLELLISALADKKNIAPNNALTQLNRTLSSLEEALRQAAQCTYSPRAIMPLERGIQKDIVVARILQAVIKCYEVVANRQPVEFAVFYEHLMAYIFNLETPRSAEQLLWLLISVSRLLAARSGSWPLPVLVNWNWLKPAVESNRQKSMFGLAGEEVAGLLHHLHPYWAARLHYNEEIKGVFGSKVVQRHGLLLVDATTPENPIVVPLAASDPLLSTVESGLHAYNLLDKDMVALPALLSRNPAEQAMNAYRKQHAAVLGIARLEIIGVIYLPAASVRYRSKKGQRQITLGLLDKVNQHVSNPLKQTQQFLEQFAV